MNSLRQQRIKLHEKLNIELSVTHFQQICCTLSLTDKEMFMLQKAFLLRSSFSETEESTLFYKSSYVAFMENIFVVEPTDAKKDFSSSEFTILKILQQFLSYRFPRKFRGILWVPPFIDPKTKFWGKFFSRFFTPNKFLIIRQKISRKSLFPEFLEQIV